MGAALGAGLGTLLGIVGKGLETHANQQLATKAASVEMWRNLIAQHPDYLNDPGIAKAAKAAGLDQNLITTLGQHAQHAHTLRKSFPIGGGSSPAAPTPPAGMGPPGITAPGGPPSSAGATAAAPRAVAGGVSASPATSAPASAMDPVATARTAADSASAAADAARKRYTDFVDATESSTDPEDAKHAKYLDEAAKVEESRRDRLTTRADRLSQESTSREDRLAARKESEDFRATMADNTRAFQKSMRDESDANNRRNFTTTMLTKLGNDASALALKLNDPNKYDQKTRQAFADAHNKTVDKTLAAAKTFGIDLGDGADYKLQVDPATGHWYTSFTGSETPGAVAPGAPALPPPPPGFKVAE